MLDSDYRPDEESEELARKLANSTVTDLRRASESSRKTDGSAITLEMHARELGIDAPMHDVTFVMEEFAWQWELARHSFGQMLCVRTGDDEQAPTVPFSLASEWPFPRQFRSWRLSDRFYPFSLDLFHAEYMRILRSRGESEGITMESSDNVLERLQSGLGDFLSYRIAGFQAWMSWIMGREQRGQGNFGGKGGRKRPGGGGGGKGRTGSGGPPPPPPSWSPGGGIGVEVCCNTPGLTIELIP
jgi:uncharacterized membrane protein YgcG